MTNFDMSRYDVKAILESNTLPIGGGAAKRLKEAQALESSRKREEMMALGSSFQYGSSSVVSSARLQQQQGGCYPLMQFDQQQPPQPFLTLQNQDMGTQYGHQDAAASFHQQGYIQTQLQLNQQSGQFYNSYLQNHPGLLQGLMNMGSSSSSSSVMENGGGGDGGGYGFMGNGSNNGLGIGMGSSNVVGSGEEHALVKVDYDMPAAGYGGWSAAADTIQGSNGGGVFTMWNDL